MLVALKVNQCAIEVNFVTEAAHQRPAKWFGHLTGAPLLPC